MPSSQPWHDELSVAAAPGLCADTLLSKGPVLLTLPLPPPQSNQAPSGSSNMTHLGWNMETGRMQD